VTAPLFDADGLCPRIIERSLPNPAWQGFVYLMHFGPREALEPLYVGKTERGGKTQPVSFNIANIRANQHAFR
jgi:hypothetical protein